MFFKLLLDLKLSFIKFFEIRVSLVVTKSHQTTTSLTRTHLINLSVKRSVGCAQTRPRDSPGSPGSPGLTRLTRTHLINLSVKRSVGCAQTRPRDSPGSPGSPGLTRYHQGHQANQESPGITRVTRLTRTHHVSPGSPRLTRYHQDSPDQLISKKVSRECSNSP